MFGYYKTLRRIKADYARLELNAIKTVPETCYTNIQRKEIKHALRPMFRYGACTAAAVAILLAGTFTALPHIGPSGTSSGKAAVSHDFALTAYAVNSSTHRKTKLNFSVNYHKGYEGYVTASIGGNYPKTVSVTIASIPNSLDFTNCLSKNMSSITYECVSGSLSTEAESNVYSKSITLKSGTKSNLITWIGPANSFEKFSDTITVTAKFTDGKSAKKQAVISFNKSNGMRVKLKDV